MTLSAILGLETIDAKSSIVLDSISFVTSNSHPSYLKIVQRAFKKILTPIYGNQASAITKIKAGEDRICEVMLKHGDPLGIIVYKNKLQNEYGLKGALELKSLFLLDPNKNSGNGFGSCLFDRIDDVARTMGTRLVYCTASSKVKNSIQCAIKNGYQISKILEKSQEHILYLLIKEI